MSNRYVRRVDEYIVRWDDSDDTNTHIVAVTWDNKIHHTALCGYQPKTGWGKRGGVVGLSETKCEECNKRAKLIGVLK